jgi:hypothetical protein
VNLNEFDVEDESNIEQDEEVDDVEDFEEFEET